ncbi:MAG: hypothetical protein ACR2MP_16160 [Streptosporangiaceae bacterium]
MHYEPDARHAAQDVRRVNGDAAGDGPRGEPGEARRAYIASLAETQITATAQVLDARAGDVRPFGGLPAAMALDEDIRSQADLLRGGG